MTHTAPPVLHHAPRFAFRRVLFATLFLLCSLSLPVRAWAVEQGQQQLTTKYFTIYYPDGEAKTAAWYASFADDVDTAVSELLGAEPVTEITLHIYATEAEYAQVNPM